MGLKPAKKRKTQRAAGDLLQRGFDSTVRRMVSRSLVVFIAIQQRLRDLNIVLTPRQRSTLRRQLRRNMDSLKLNISRRQLALAGLTEEALSVALSKPLDEEVKQAVGDLERVVQETIPKSIADAGRIITKGLKKRTPEALRWWRTANGRFESRLRRVWRKPLVRLQALIMAAADAGSLYDSASRQAVAVTHPYAFEALTRLQGRACQIAAEILALLSSGHADGAHARWRSLHEIAVVASFIVSRGEDLAERYLLHEGIESYKSAVQYQEYCRALGYRELSATEMAYAQDKRDKLLDRFGKEYRSEYGWAAKALCNQQPTFRDIERASGLDHFRPYYKMASHNVHASPTGIFFRLGVPKNMDVLLLGASMHGLEEPGRGAAISLAQVTIAFLTLSPNVDRLVCCHCVSELARDAERAFDAQASMRE